MEFMCIYVFGGITAVPYPLISHGRYATLKPLSWDNYLYPRDKLVIALGARDAIATYLFFSCTFPPYFTRLSLEKYYRKRELKK